MDRSPKIPLFLWIATAIVAHLLWSGTAEQVARVVEEQADLREFARGVRGYVQQQNQAFAITLLDSDAEESDTPEASNDGDPNEAEGEELPAEPTAGSNGSDPDTEADKTPSEGEPSADTKPEELPPQSPPEEPEAIEVPAPTDPLPTLRLQGRIAVQQHVEDKNQDDNEDAALIADEANHVDRESQARITATDQNDPDPNPGSSSQGPTDAPGNSHVTDIAQSQDRAGEVDRSDSAGESGAEVEASYSQPAGGGGVIESAPRGTAQGSDRSAAPDSDSAPASPGQKARQAIAATPAAPELVTAQNGTGRAGKAQQEPPAQAAQEAKKKRLPPRKGAHGSMQMLGLGKTGTTVNGINLTLSPGSALATIGLDRMRQERIDVAEQRRSKHRGSWKAQGLERWRASIENYVSSVKPGNQTALNTARAPFAS